MKATILAITLDTEGQEDLVLSTAQLVQAVRASMAFPANGASSGRAVQAQLPPPVPAAPAEAAPGPLPGVTVRPLASEAPAGDSASDNTAIFTRCIDCGEPKPATKSPRCRKCAVKRGQLAARMEKATRHNDNGEN